MGASTGYDPRQHAQMVGEQHASNQEVLRRLAAIEGQLSRLAAAWVAAPDLRDSNTLDALVVAIWKAMGHKTWIVADLVDRAGVDDPPGRDLDAAIQTCARKQNARSLGIFLATAVPPTAGHITADSLEIRRSGLDRGVVAYAVLRV